MFYTAFAAINPPSAYNDELFPSPLFPSPSQYFTLSFFNLICRYPRGSGVSVYEPNHSTNFSRSSP
eukprot:UN01702